MPALTGRVIWQGQRGKRNAFLPAEKRVLAHAAFKSALKFFANERGDGDTRELLKDEMWFDRR